MLFVSGLIYALAQQIYALAQDHDRQRRHKKN